MLSCTTGSCAASSGGEKKEAARDTKERSPPLIPCFSYCDAMDPFREGEPKEHHHR